MGNCIKRSTDGRGAPSHSHTCTARYGCLGALTFHTAVVGSQISLSLDARRADRARGTFQNGMVFTSRPVKVKEKICLRVEAWDQHWGGAVRLGFTTVPPSAEAQAAAVVIPDLTDKPGYWAAAVPDSFAALGSELRFWADSRGRVYFEQRGGRPYEVINGVDVSQKLWAVIDVYGQTRAVLLLGSEKKRIFWWKKSCRTPPPPPVSVGDSCLCVSKGRPCHARHRSASPPQQQQLPDTAPPTGVHSEEICSVCLSETARVILPCGHRCLCSPCAKRVTAQFGTCPLCRWPISQWSL